MLPAARIFRVVLLLLVFSAGSGQATLVMRVIRASRPSVSLLHNGGFEAIHASQVKDWQPWQKGFRLAPGEGRAGSQAITCESATGEGEFGAGQTLLLNRSAAAPLVVSGWSKAVDVNGSPDSGYSLYVDLVYTDLYVAEMYEALGSVNSGELASPFSVRSA